MRSDEEKLEDYRRRLKEHEEKRPPPPEVIAARERLKARAAVRKAEEEAEKGKRLRRERRLRPSLLSAEVDDKGVKCMRRALSTLKWLMIGGLVVLVVQLNPFYRLSYTVNTYGGWCRQLLGGTHPGLAIGFDHKAIRDDFVPVLNQLVVTWVAKDCLGGASRDDKVVRELERLKMIGAWAAGDTLYVANRVLITDEELGIDQFDDLRGLFRRNLGFFRLQGLTDEEYSEWRDGMTDAEYCMWATINDHFAKCVLVGPGNRSVTIPLEFRWKKELSGSGNVPAH